MGKEILQPVSVQCPNLGNYEAPREALVTPIVIKENPDNDPMILNVIACSHARTCSTVQNWINKKEIDVTANKESCVDLPADPKAAVCYNRRSDDKFDIRPCTFGNRVMTNGRFVINDYQVS